LPRFISLQLRFSLAKAVLPREDAPNMQRQMPG
jgi:hypothetical protein